MHLLFTGFNAFGQHAYKSGQRALGFSEISVPAEAAAGKFLIALSWRYTAYASGSTICLRGLLHESQNECVKAQAPAAIKALAAAEAYCLVLLETGKLYKLPAKLDATLQSIVLEEAPAAPSRAPKRSIFGLAKQQLDMPTPNITHIACGTHINVAISSDNNVWSIPSLLHQFAAPPWRVQQLACGHEHALLLNANGDIYSWGNGLRGQLGQVVLRSEESPLLLEALAGIKITYIAAGGWHSAAISAFGDVYTWGFNSNGQLAMRVLKPDTVLKEPTVYPLPQVHDLPACCEQQQQESCAPLSIHAGARHTVLLRSCGRLWASGWCAYGQLGDQHKQPYLDGFKMMRDKGEKVDTEVICGPWATLLVLSS